MLWDEGSGDFIVQAKILQSLHSFRMTSTYVVILSPNLIRGKNLDLTLCLCASAVSCYVLFARKIRDKLE